MLTMNHTLHREWDQAAGELNTIPLVDERVRYAAAIKPLLAIPKTSCILEVGCGSGRLLRALAALGYQDIVGLEISPSRLRQVTRFGPSDARLICSNVVPFVSEAYDAVVSAAVIEHVVAPADFLAELARVTRAGGVISIVTDTYMWSWLKKLGLYRTRQPLDEAIWPRKIIRWARQAGLELIGCAGFVNTPDQQGYFGKQLLRLVPLTSRMRHWLNRAPKPVVASDEAGAILEAVQGFDNDARVDLWSCIWSYECYYWFRKS
jgi:SAM-dependent methyltransferase